MGLLFLSLMTLMTFSTVRAQFQLSITNPQILDDPSKAGMFTNGELNLIYNDTIYNMQSNCRSGDLQIINNTFGNSLFLVYSGFPLLNSSNTYISQSPNEEPHPAITYDLTSITITFNCPSSISNHNYYNKIQLYLPDAYHVSFLLNCDPDNRHKPFEYGYLILSIINAAIIIGVAMHSHIWSIKWKGAPLGLQLKWIPFAIFNAISIVLLVALYAFAYSDFSSAFKTLRFVGIGVSAVFVFICFNECFYLIKKLRNPLYKVIRWCDASSIICTIVIITISALIQSWVLYDILATCICVGCIKLLYFQTLKQAFISMGIYVLNVTSIAIALHYMLNRSYNDYATELSSPLFFEVPDLIDSLFKKCSWLVVVDVIVPGVTLSYLRMYDENRSSPYGGIYTVWGNVTFVLSTALWVGLEAIYPFSIPFCLVTYLSLILVIITIAWTRNDWKTLREGTFQKSRSTLKDELLVQKGERFSLMVEDAIFDPLKNSVGKQSNDSASREKLM